MATKKQTDKTATNNNVKDLALSSIANYQWGHDGRENALTRIIRDMQKIAANALEKTG